MSIRDELGYIVGRGTATTLKILGRSGTTLPGYLAERVSPDVLRATLRRRDYGLRIIVTGTNGKTTTARLVSKLLRAEGWSVITNSAGSNLYRGVTTAALKRPRSQKAALVLEVDEASLPRVAEAVEPTHVVVLNIFRDQLDRYGEVSTTQRYISDALKGLATVAILCGDDPWVAMLPDLVNEAGLKASYFGLALPDLKALPHDQAADYPLSPKTHSPLGYTQRYFSHLGKYQAIDKSWSRPVIDVAVTQYKATSDKVEIVYSLYKKHHKIVSPLVGVYNAYNLAAVACLAASLGIATEVVAEIVATTTPAFGRQEVVHHGQFDYQFYLIKNPTGFNQVLQSAFTDRRDKRPTLIVINDNFADGRDVSWLWDTALEDMVCDGEILVSGTRAYDMALRLEYAGRACRVVPEIEDALTELQQLGDKLRILPTYTALLQIRKQLGLQLGGVE